MKVAAISYHKNAREIYPAVWTNRHILSVLHQTYRPFDIYELDYGGNGERLFSNSVYSSYSLPTFVHAMNELLDRLFNDEGYDAVANLNCDDWYARERLEVQLPFIEQGYDIVSSNFCLVRNNHVTHRHYFDKLDIGWELKKNNNIIAHPAVVFSKGFWKKNRYRPEEVPVEDMLLWKRALQGGSRIKIVEDFLLYHTVHENSVCNSLNR